MASHNNQGVVRRQAENKKDDIHIRITNIANAMVTYSVSRSSIQTSTLLHKGPLHRPNQQLGMGQTLQDAVYQDQVLLSILARLDAWRSNNTPPFIYALTSPLVATIYRETPPSATLCKFITDAIVCFGNEDDVEHFRNDTGYPEAFVRDVMVALGKAKRRSEQRVVMVASAATPGFLERAGGKGVPRPFWNEERECGERKIEEIGKREGEERWGKRRYTRGDSSIASYVSRSDLWAFRTTHVQCCLTYCH
jgi:hypothetical protein